MARCVLTRAPRVCGDDPGPWLSGTSLIVVLPAYAGMIRDPHTSHCRH